MNESFEKPAINTKGRGSGSIAKSRFADAQIFYDEEDARQIKTHVFKDFSKSIVSFNNSPDVGMKASVNPYRGCEHGCIYCYARPTHEYFGLSAGLDFESKIFAKFDAKELLYTTLNKKNWHPQVVAMSGVTDCYQPVEKHLQLTRGCLESLLLFKNPVVIITKNYLVTRDLDLFSELNKFNAIHVCISITTLDAKLANKMEPRASSPERRLLAVNKLASANIPVSVNVAPLIPGLTDHETPRILKAVKDAGARNADYVMLRLPNGVKDLFRDWLHENYPEREDKILNRIRDVRGGQMYSSDFFSRMTGEGIYAQQIGQMFEQYCKLYKLNGASKLSTEHFSRPKIQLGLFD